MGCTKESIPLSADVLSIFIIFPAIVFSENLPCISLVLQACTFEISHNFLYFAFIGIHSVSVPEASVEIITADFRIIIQKR
jgi:hypothetical protein